MKILSLYNRKYILYLLLVFVFFLVIILFTEYRNEKKYRIESLNKDLYGYTNLINNYLQLNKTDNYNDSSTLSAIVKVLPDKNMRVTLIDITGKVLFDSQKRDYSTMENHLTRPEIILALKAPFGTNIRVSNTTNIKYYYYAVKFPDYFVRLSLKYDIEARSLIEPNKLSLLSIVVLFLISSVVLVLISNPFNRSVANLKQFAMLANADVPIEDEMNFPRTELGNIGQEIISIYKNLNAAKQELSAEKEKLVRHLDVIEEGIVIFNADKKIIVSNSNFIRFINLISEKTISSPEKFFAIEDFNPIFEFIDYHKNENSSGIFKQPSYEININKNGKYFTIKCMAFQDNTFEILIYDNTKHTKRKLLKQQMTDNIAHELKTPVSSVRGYLETILNLDLDNNKQEEFIKKAYAQTCRLTDLINDISLLTKIEEAGSLYELELINLKELVSSLIEDIDAKIKEQNIKVTLCIPDSVQLYGNQVLLYSVFRNLLDNGIKYAGYGTVITINQYSEDNQNYFFSFADNGIGVPEKDLQRLFERFYRVDKGRVRKSGGTGLGLSIVKNAIEFHKGNISVKNRKEGGLEFLFSINRKLKSKEEM